jgi:hypothetical protein
MVVILLPDEVLDFVVIVIVFPSFETTRRLVAMICIPLA